jgi:superfamily I DNA/RNA helicase
MIEMFNSNNKSLPVKIAIVDEAQDLTTLQWKMIWIAFRDCDKIYIAGDDDQAIYEWSGADVAYFLSINGSIDILHQSYRLPNQLLHFSKQITELIEYRVKKDYKGFNSDGQVLYIKHIDEVFQHYNKDETWMFLSRNRYFLNSVEEYIRNLGLIYTKYKEHSVSKKHITAINLFEKIRKNNLMSNTEEIQLKLHLKKNIDLSTPWYKNFNWDIDTIMYYRDIIANKTDMTKCNIKINTIHGVKGDEADNVVILDSITNTVYQNLSNNPDSEHRVFYVGCTRAKKRLFIMVGDYKYKYKFY